MKKMNRYRRLISIFNALSVGQTFTKDDLVDWLKNFYPTAKKSNLSYFMTTLKWTTCCESKFQRGIKTIYKKLRHLDKADVQLVAMEYAKRYSYNKPKVEEKIVEKVSEETRDVSHEQIQKVVETCLVLTKQNKELKDENEQLKKEKEELKQQNLMNLLIKKAEEVTGIHIE